MPDWRTLLSVAPVLFAMCGAAHAQPRLDAYEAASQYRDTITHATDLYMAAGMAPPCGFRDWPWMFRIQALIQSGEQKNIENYATFTDDKDRFRNLALQLFQEQAERMRQFDRVVMHGVPASACLDLRSSGVLDRMDELVKGLAKP